MRRAIAFAAVVLALALCTTAAADIPETISYQGVLRDSDGNPVPDGTYSFTFRLYDVAAGGTALWTETQSIAVAGGILNAHLGSVVTLTTLDFLVPYWLGIQIGMTPELSPRVAFETVPYAAHAVFADNFTAGGWQVDGDAVYHQIGNVGIGTSDPQVRLDVVTTGDRAADFSNAAGGDTSTIFVTNARGTAAAFHSCAPAIIPPPVNTAIYASGRCGARAGHFSGSTAEAIYAESGGSVPTLSVQTWNPGSLSAQFAGGIGIRVDQQAEVGGFKMPTGAAAGYVLTSDGTGVGSWQAGASDGDWVISGTSMYSGVSGNVGIGNASPYGKLDVASAGSAEALMVSHAGSSVARAVNIERTSTPAALNDILQITVPAASPDDFQYVEFDRGGTVNFAVNGDGRVTATGVDVATSATYAGNFSTNVVSASAHAVHGEFTAVGSIDGVGVYGKSVPADYYGYGGYFQGGYRGVIGYVQPTGSSLYRGVNGQVSGGTGTNYGVYGYAASGNVNYGVFGQAAGGTTNYAGYFNGNTHVAGTFTATTKSFRIDHPLDPTGKYLQHSCVESDQMKNVYDGVVVLDASGTARVRMPEWFEALNQDFRYQLTCIGGFAPVYIAEEMSGNAFAIAGGEAGMKVSWMVTGVRHDAYARANALEVEIAKPAQELGKYMHPEAYGMPETAGVNYHDDERPLPESASSVAPPSVLTNDLNDGE